VDATTRLITTIYLSENEFTMLRSSLQGLPIKKLRHKLQPIQGIPLSVDEFQDGLAGLVFAEAEFESSVALENFPMLDFAVREVTADPRFSGGSLARSGIPDSL
jgi:CYTH domain-containing protein